MPSASPSATATIRTSSRSEPEADEPFFTSGGGVIAAVGGRLGGVRLAGPLPAPARRPPRRAPPRRRRRPPRRRDRGADPPPRPPPPDRCTGARAHARACRPGRAGSRAWPAGRRRGRRPRCARSSASAAGNVRSTPTPKDCLRTVKVSRTPSPCRLMTTPSKTWVRRRVPSTTWKCTFTRSPDWKRGTRRSCARSRESMTVLMARRASAGVDPPRKRRPMVADPRRGDGSARGAIRGSARGARRAARRAPSSRASRPGACSAGTPARPRAPG